jgi:hypothetical protein
VNLRELLPTQQQDPKSGFEMNLRRSGGGVGEHTGFRHKPEAATSVSGRCTPPVSCAYPCPTPLDAGRSGSPWHGSNSNQSRSRLTNHPRVPASQIVCQGEDTWRPYNKSNAGRCRLRRLDYLVGSGLIYRDMIDKHSSTARCSLRPRSKK